MKNTAVVAKKKKSVSETASEAAERRTETRKGQTEKRGETAEIKTSQERTRADNEKQRKKTRADTEAVGKGTRATSKGTRAADKKTPTAENKKPVKHEKLYSVLTGASAGLINGVFGGGGGMIVVPMLVYLLKKEPRVAHATAILLILPMSIVSGLLYASFGSFRWQTGLPVGIGVVIGGALGAVLLGKLSSKWIIVVFSLVMAAAGVKMLFF